LISLSPSQAGHVILTLIEMMSQDKEEQNTFMGAFYDLDILSPLYFLIEI